MIFFSRADSASRSKTASGTYTPCTSHPGRPRPISGSHSRVSSQDRYSAAVAAVSQPQCRPITSCTISIREPELCSAMMFWANREPCSAAVQAPSDCLIGMTSLSMVFGSPTTVRA